MNLHHPEARVRMAVPESGERPHDYGTGRLCAAEGCTTVLSRYNRGPVCDCCERKGVKVSENKSDDRAQVLELLRYSSAAFVTRARVAHALGLTERAVAQHVSRLCKQGYEIEIGDYEGSVTYTYKSAPGGPPAPAPDPTREPPAEEAAAPVPGTPAGAPPFAGQDVDAVGSESVWLDAARSGWVERSELIVSPDREVVAIESCVAVLEDLEQAARDRVITYLGQRYWT